MNDNTMIHDEGKFAIRYFVLGLCCVLASVLVLHYDAVGRAGGSKFSEGDATESAQLIYLVIATLLFLVAAVRSKERRALSSLMVGGALVLIIRELDGLLDGIFHGAWAPLAIGVAVGTCAFAARWRERFAETVSEFIKTPAFGTLSSASLSLFVFSRLFGMKVLWKSFFEVENLSGEQRGVKVAVEEGSELFGYSLLLLGAYAFYQFATRPSREGARAKT